MSPILPLALFPHLCPCSLVYPLPCWGCWRSMLSTHSSAYLAQAGGQNPIGKGMTCTMVTPTCPSHTALLLLLPDKCPANAVHNQPGNCEWSLCFVCESLLQNGQSSTIFASLNVFQAFSLSISLRFAHLCINLMLNYHCYLC